jgi:addiction module HigA family antidote
MKLDRTNKITLAENHPTPARETLQETMDYYKISQTDLANRIGVSQSYLSDVLNGKKYLSAVQAVAIEEVTGIPADLLVQLDANYLLWEARQEKLQPSISTAGDMFLKRFDWAVS